MAIPVPTLSTAGWVTSPAKKADALISHFYESDKRQTALYGNNVSNLQWIIERYGNDITLVCQQLRTELENYLGRYYPVVVVDVRTDDVLVSPGTKVTLHLFISVTEDGKEYSVAKLIEAVDSKFARIVDLNNNGTPS